METAFHPLSELFKQLGLPMKCHEIEKFITDHAPLDPVIYLAEASFWTASQKSFLADELLKDADWAEVIDLLNVRLRGQY